jgi:putative DNA primase/helicase
VWDEAVKGWSKGDKGWEKLLLAVGGYAMVSDRSFQRWVMLQGAVRGGKGTFLRFLTKCLGKTGVVNRQLKQLGRQFGTKGLETARLLVLGDVAKGAGIEGESVAEVLKKVVGQDELAVEGKYKENLEGVTTQAMLIMASNPIPLLPNDGGGLSAKMLVLPYTYSFLGKEIRDLDKKLWEEREGIVKKMVREFGEVVRTGKWPEAKATQDVMRAFKYVNNPMESFLGARFVPNEGAFVPKDMLWNAWLSFKKETGMTVRVLSNEFLNKMVRETTWGLIKIKQRWGEGNKEQSWGLKGLAPKAENDDED